MLIQAVTYTFAPERADEAERLLRELRAASLKEPGCAGFEVSRGNNDATTFLLFETWDDEAALEAHYATDHFKRLGINGIRPLAASRAAYLGTPIG